MAEKTEPLFDHDCDKCNFLGSFKSHDLYHCKQGNSRDTIIARYGSNGPDYKSGLVFADMDEHIGEGKRLAKKRNFLKD